MKRNKERETAWEFDDPTPTKSSRTLQRKTQQFCRQVQRALNLALAERIAVDVECDLFVENVLPPRTDGPDRVERYKQAGSSHLPAHPAAVLRDPLSPGSASAADGGHRHEYRNANERNSGLQWKDIDFEQATLTIQRSVVGRFEDETKTLASASVLPLHGMLIGELHAWQAREKDVNGWLFGNIDTVRPYHADSLRKDHLAPAGRKAGIPNLGWHNFRHTYRARLGSSGATPELQQKLMRHSSIDMTMKYGQNNMLD